uniref:Uncharacterized protein n=1 Tax=Spongospora subterranea TaxID=70186 RepID=A0A0H5QRF7_9EUKA|eukprot:CRZ04207.1 hypothetical protein [Spongospora subterranea]
MQDRVVLNFVQRKLEAGECNADIVQGLREHHQVDISHRTRQRWIKKHQLQRSLPVSAAIMSTEWIDDVQALIIRNIPLQDIRYQLQRNYCEHISLRTLEKISQVNVYYSTARAVR